MRLIKRIAAVILAAAVTFTTAVLFSAAETIACGDVDGDGTVTVMDATVIQRVLAHMQQPTDPYDSVGDVDADGEVTIADATLIQRFQAKMIPSLPFEPYAPTQAPTAYPTDSEGWGTIIIRP